MTNLCGFGKRAHLPLLEHTADTTSYNILNDLSGTILLSKVVQGDKRAAQSWDFQTVFPGKLLSRNKMS